MVRANGFSGLFQWIRRVGIHFAITRVECALGCVHQVGGVIEFRHDSVNRFRLHSFTFDCGSSARISKIEIAGMNLMNRKNNNVKKPMVPSRVMMSHLVGQYMPQELGIKSRCRLITTITKRSSHIPHWMTQETRNRPSGDERTLLNHSDCGVMMLQRIRK